MWISTTLLSDRIANNRWVAIALVVVIAVCLRAAPELVAFPHPIGYDTINYYIPVITNLEEHFSSISDDFPLYVLALYSIMITTGLSPHAVVVGSAVAVFGLFSVAVFTVSRTLLKLTQWQSILVTIFVVVQLSVLRTAWDLHRDLLALSLLLFIFSLLSSRERSHGTTAVLVVLTCFTVALDRMVGLVFLASIVTGAVLSRNKRMALLSTISGGLFICLLMVGNAGTPGSQEMGGAIAKNNPALPSGLDYLVLFAVLNGAIAIPAILGFARANQVLLRVPLIVTGVGSFSWLAFSESSILVPERWMILFGIFASLFAGYFILKMVQSQKHKHVILASVLLAFGTIGVAYAVLPYDHPFPLLALAKANIEQFFPVTMQFNALDVQNNEDILATIQEINANTEEDAVIVGAKHWRGFMELHLEDRRTYKFSENPTSLAAAHARIGEAVYLVQPDATKSGFVTSKIEDSGRK